MAEALPCHFDVWLRDTLAALNTDDEVFSPYIKGILEGDENQEEKLEALQGILGEIATSGIDALCDEIIKKWTLFEDKPAPTEEEAEKTVQVEDKIAEIMVKQAQQVVTTKTSMTKEQESLKNAILAQYSQVSDGEEEYEEEEEERCVVLPKNTNAEDVARAEREKRDRNKEDAQKKKDKDKEDRAKQKIKEDERKEKEKKRTQKGERRR